MNAQAPRRTHIELGLHRSTENAGSDGAERPRPHRRRALAQQERELVPMPIETFVRQYSVDSRGVG
jgi:hypothetical protein